MMDEELVGISRLDLNAFTKSSAIPNSALRERPDELAPLGKPPPPMPPLGRSQHVWAW